MDEESDTERVVLPLDAFAVTFEPGQGFNLYLPRSVSESGGDVPDEATALLACAARLKNDPAFLREQVAWMEKQGAEMTAAEAGGMSGGAQDE